MLRLVYSPMQQLQMAIDGGVTESMFPVAEQMLLEGLDFQASLEFVAARKNMNRYISMMDFLLCEVYRDQQRACFMFYQGVGEPLRCLITEQQRKRYESGLIIALKEARNLFRESQSTNWGFFYERVHVQIKKMAA